MAGQLLPPSGCRWLLLALLLSVSLRNGHAVVKSVSSGGSRTTTGAGSTTATGTSRTSVYGSSYGTQTRLRIVTAAVIATVYFNSFNYPAVRLNYEGYYDECALKNATAAQAGLSDAAIDFNTVDTELPPLLNGNAVTGDVYAFNQSLYNATNGLVVDPAYCNYTSTSSSGGGGGSGASGSLRLRGWGVVAWAVVVGAVGAWAR